MLDVLQADFERLPELLGREVAAVPPAALAPEPAREPAAVQLGLF
jgi:hypothetical protein